jgi:hypothetical protein
MGSSEDGSKCKARPKLVAEVILKGVVALFAGKTATKERMAMHMILWLGR